MVCSVQICQLKSCYYVHINVTCTFLLKKWFSWSGVRATQPRLNIMCNRHVFELNHNRNGPYRSIDLDHDFKGRQAMISITHQFLISEFVSNYWLINWQHILSDRRISAHNGWICHCYSNWSLQPQCLHHVMGAINMFTFPSQTHPLIHSSVI